MDLAECYLDGNADAVEFCPHDSYHHVLAAATYTLQEGPQPSRAGSISLFNVDADEGKLDLFHRIETAGVFDIKWNPVADNRAPVLAQADANGFLRLHGLECSNELDSIGKGLEEISSESISSSMCLCLDWNPSATSISVGLSDGSVSIISLQESGLSMQEEWRAHDFEVWATVFDVYQPQLVYSGSDDCKLSCHDLRENPSSVVFQNTKVHKMGVCCIAKSPTDANSLLTGSYDEYLRVWDIRSISRPVTETSLCLGGGVWRIKHHPSVPGVLLAACMHNGFSVVNIEGEDAKVVETYTKHTSLAYGADWMRGRRPCKANQGKCTAVATCSFYDKMLRLWIPQTELFE